MEIDRQLIGKAICFLSMYSKKKQTAFLFFSENIDISLTKTVTKKTTKEKSCGEYINPMVSQQ